jgi:hypothetical protein
VKKLLICILLFATPVAAQERERGWLDVNFGIATAAEDSISTVYSVVQDEEVATYGVAYEFPRGASFDFGGGVMFTDLLGVGVNFQGTAHMAPAGLVVRIPHPLRFNAFATDADVTQEDLERTEGSINLQLMVKAPIANDKLRVRFFGGPSYFTLKADGISNILYEQDYGLFTTVNIVDITEYETTEVNNSGWGFHAGGDVAFMFTRVFGLGGFARFSRGTVDVSANSGVLSDEDVDVKVGGFQAGGGIRLRF